MAEPFLGTAAIEKLKAVFVVGVEVPLEYKCVAWAAVRPVVAGFGGPISFASFAAFIHGGKTVSSMVTSFSLLAGLCLTIIDEYVDLLAGTIRWAWSFQTDVPTSTDPAAPFPSGEGVAPGHVAGSAQPAFPCFWVVVPGELRRGIVGTGRIVERFRKIAKRL